jgi:hypothetical protein
MEFVEMLHPESDHPSTTHDRLGFRMEVWDLTNEVADEPKER